MIQATIEVLRSGREVRVLEIAEAAGVSHSLIYRHFPDGGREELIAEAYARIFRGLTDEDIEAATGFSREPELLRQQLVGFYTQLLSPQRTPQRWARLEALAHARINSFVAERIEQTRRELVKHLTALYLQLSDWPFPRDRVEAFATVMLSIPLGLTAMLPMELTELEIDQIAQTWAELTIGWLSRAHRPPMEAPD